MHITTRNVNTAFHTILEIFTLPPTDYSFPDIFKITDSRNGQVLRLIEPLTITYTSPQHHVLINEVRLPNPFFHLFEALWMLAGRNDIAFPAQFNSRMKSYSDDGRIQWGAYGHRWQHWFGYNQLDRIIRELKRDPNSRRCVLAMYDPEKDAEFIANGNPKDIPCNTHAYFQIIDNELHMTVCNRSNDIMWGMLGANAVHFSLLAEYIATCLGLPKFIYHHFTTNAHLYLDIYPQSLLNDMLAVSRSHRMEHDAAVARGELTTRSYFPLVTDLHSFRNDLTKFLHDPTAESPQQFLHEVARPLYRAWLCHKQRDYPTAFSILDQAMDYHRLCYTKDWMSSAYTFLITLQARYLSRNPYVSEAH